MSAKETQDIQSLEVIKIAETIDRLRTRIHERFHESSLEKISESLTQVAQKTGIRVNNTRKPNIVLRVTTVLVVLVITSGIIFIVQIGLQNWRLESDAAGTIAGLDSAVSLLIVLGAALWYLISLEERLKRKKVLVYLHELRSFAHNIDMNQLTVDPHVVMHPDKQTSVSPQRNMTEFELVRYLDYSSEMLSLVGKLAALYAEGNGDNEIVETVNDIEGLTTNLSRKIWQKIMVLASMKGD